MIVTQTKPIEEILAALTPKTKIFLIGCGECATSCQTGGEPQLKALKSQLEQAGKDVLGYCLPKAPCVAAQIKTELAKNIPLLRQAEAVIVLSCGLGVQSFKDNDRLGLSVISGCNTLAAAVMDAQGNFLEKCLLCSECLLSQTEGVCPVALCPKGILNGPCGGMNKGKCETDNERDCAWALIYDRSIKAGHLEQFKKIKAPRDGRKYARPHKVILNPK